MKEKRKKGASSRGGKARRAVGNNIRTHTHTHTDGDGEEQHRGVVVVLGGKQHANRSITHQLDTRHDLEGDSFFSLYMGQGRVVGAMVMVVEI